MIENQVADEAAKLAARGWRLEDVEINDVQWCAMAVRLAARFYCDATGRLSVKILTPAGLVEIYSSPSRPPDSVTFLRSRRMVFDNPAFDGHHGDGLPVHDHERFPHRCSKCGRWCYVGLQSVEHERGECR